MNRTGGTFITAELAMEYGIADIDGTAVPSMRAERGSPIWRPIAETGQGLTAQGRAGGQRVVNARPVRPRRRPTCDLPAPVMTALPSKCPRFMWSGSLRVRTARSDSSPLCRKRSSRVYTQVDQLIWR